MKKLLLRNLANKLDLLRPEKFYILAWQECPGQYVPTSVENIKDFHSCGNTACIAGYAALLPDWQEAGLKPDLIGRPVLYQHGARISGAAAFSAVSDIHIDLACAITTDLAYPLAYPFIGGGTHSKEDAHDALKLAVMNSCDGYQSSSNAQAIQTALCSIVDKPWAKWNQKDAAKVLHYIIDLRLQCELGAMQ